MVLSGAYLPRLELWGLTVIISYHGFGFIYLLRRGLWDVSMDVVHFKYGIKITNFEFSVACLSGSTISC